MRVAGKGPRLILETHMGLIGQLVAFLSSPLLVNSLLKYCANNSILSPQFSEYEEIFP